ncbi:TPA: hypothetical protein ACG3PB_003808 [Clostridioides difficile]
MDNINNNEAVVEAEIANNNDDEVTVQINNENVVIDLKELNKMSKSKIEDTYKITKDKLDKILEEAGLYYIVQKRGKGKTKIWSKTQVKTDGKKDTKEAEKVERIPIGLSINSNIKQDLKECASILDITETKLLEEAIQAYIASNIAEILKKKKEQDKKRNSIIDKYK